jgi:hypothetical protein
MDTYGIPANTAWAYLVKKGVLQVTLNKKLMRFFKLGQLHNHIPTTGGNESAEKLKYYCQ